MKMKSRIIAQMLPGLWPHITLQRRLQLMILLLLMLLTSIIEVVGIGALMPFLAILSSPDTVTKSPVIVEILGYLNIKSKVDLLFLLTLTFLLATLLSGLMRVLLIWVSSKTAFEIGADICDKLFLNSLQQSYIFHLSTNSSNLISTISSETNLVIYNVIIPILTLATSCFLLVFISCAMIFINPFVALNAVIGFGVIYIFVGLLARSRLKKNGEIISKNSAHCIKALQEGLGGVRDVLVGGTQNTFVKIFQTADYKLRRAQGINLFIAQSPRYITETLGMTLVILLAYILAIKSDEIDDGIIPTLGFLALAAQRLLPALQQGYVAWTNLVASADPLHKVVNLLNANINKSCDIHPPALLPFTNLIELKNVSFTYPQQKSSAISNISLSINKGERVGFIGSSGSGKSTLMDIILGLLEPTSGGIYIDGVLVNEVSRGGWQLNVANVSQSIYLSDSSIEENIAFGFPVEKIDRNQVYAAAHAAHLSSVIEALPQKYLTPVGERGVRFSGGATSTNRHSSSLI
ncbi:ABC transporter ATP-binding protein [Polynucleobacter sp. AP-Jannik-300A-C4]|uniref:ATP-binding cassette domain-containing protein n=1 Tax=Polynucleobacter sp. AP-Jannik-300A-C4 TaxID=2576928 RepID=UPI001BFD3470|nr:ABC transporter ATP-binding protein [Polynucleobacter sp. AP-Jannik-300A-C4]QWE22927.1 ABC transporter ATP-binding protein [Polynucleobacter sp. AP-Jannik-300A-C4]